MNNQRLVYTELLTIPALRAPRSIFFLPYGIPINLQVGIGVSVSVRKVELTRVHSVKIDQPIDFARVESFEDHPTVVLVHIQCRPRLLSRHEVFLTLDCEDSDGIFSFALVVLFNGVEPSVFCLEQAQFPEFESLNAKVCRVSVSPYILSPLDSGFTLSNSNTKMTYDFKCIVSPDLICCPQQGSLAPNSEIKISTKLMHSTRLGVLPITICLSEESHREDMNEEILAYHNSIATVTSPCKVRVPTVHARESVVECMTQSRRNQVSVGGQTSQAIFDYSLTHDFNTNRKQMAITIFVCLPDLSCEPRVTSEIIVEDLTENLH